MELTFNYTKEDIQKASHLKRAAHRKRSRKITIPLGLFVILIWIISLPLNENKFSLGSFLLLSLGLFLLLEIDIIVPIIIRFINNLCIAKNKNTLSATQKLLINDEGVTFENKYGKTLTKWNSFIKYVIEKNIVLLYLSRNTALNIPKRIFNKNQQKEFIEIIKRKIVGSNSV